MKEKMSVTKVTHCQNTAAEITEWSRGHIGTVGTGPLMPISMHSNSRIDVAF